MEYAMINWLAAKLQLHLMSLQGSLCKPQHPCPKKPPIGLLFHLTSRSSEEDTFTRRAAPQYCWKILWWLKSWCIHQYCDALFKYKFATSPLALGEPYGINHVYTSTKLSTARKCCCLVMRCIVLAITLSDGCDASLNARAPSWA